MTETSSKVATPKKALERRLARAFHSRSSAAMAEEFYRRFPTTRPEVPQPTETIEVQAKGMPQPVEIPAPRSQRRTARQATTNFGTIVLKKTWGTVVFVLDMAAEVVKGAGKMLAFYLTPEVWLLVNTFLLGYRAIARAWMLFHPKTDTPQRMLDWGAAWTLQQTYSYSLTAISAVCLAPSWILQPLRSETRDLRVQHDLRRFDVAYEATTAWDENKFQAQYLERVAMQIDEYENELAQARAAQAKKPKEKPATVPAPTSADEEAEQLRRKGYFEVAPKIDISRDDMAHWQVAMDKAAYRRAFGHLNASLIRMDSRGRFWALPAQGQPLYKLAPEGPEEAMAAAPEPTAAERQPASVTVRGVLKEMDEESEAWSLHERGSTERSRLYGMHRAYAEVSKNQSFLHDKRRRDRIRHEVEEDIKNTRSLKLRVAMKSYDDSIAKLTEALPKPTRNRGTAKKTAAATKKTTKRASRASVQREIAQAATAAGVPKKTTKTTESKAKVVPASRARRVRVSKTA